MTAAPFPRSRRRGAAPDRPAPIAVLGPTNTGKTHYALERMLAHESGVIGLPLRLLAREIYDRIRAVRGEAAVALVTGEEKISPPGARYLVCTVEAMPVDRPAAFLAIDEVQLAADAERGRVFTSRLLSARGEAETLFLGSDTMRPILRSLIPDIRFLARDRLSTLSYAGPKKISRLPRRCAIVGFSAEQVYAIAELIRRQRGGAAVVLGALSPRTRNAQAALYQSGEVDYLVATDAIGMGLNMDIDHVAFSSRRKFDGRGFRDLRHDEIAQIAGRAGRYMRDGSFGATGECPAFDDETVKAVEDHVFEPVRLLQWRSEALDFSSLAHLLASLGAGPERAELRRARPDDDELALAALAREEDVARAAGRGDPLRLLWEACQIPDFRKSAFEHHARLVGDVFLLLAGAGRIPDAWLAPKIAALDRADGDIDALSRRIAHVRTWTYLSHRADWLENAAYWQEKARSIEDMLSDALHEKLTQRFVDRRTSILLKRLKDDAPILAGVTEDGEVIVEGQFVGRLMGFEFIVDPRARGMDARRMRSAAERALGPVLAARAAAIATASPEDLKLTDDGVVQWRSAPVARLEKGPAPLRPNLVVRGLDALSAHLRGRISDRLADFFAARVEVLLGELVALAQAVGDEKALGGQARGVGFRLVENFGAMSRTQFGEELRQLGQDERAKLRNLGVRFGEFTIYMPKLLKPGPARLLILLWSLWSGRAPGAIAAPKPGLVSLPVDADLPHAFYYAAGYRPSGARAVRIDMLERLAGQIRSERNEKEFGGGFEVSQQMMSLVGCSGEDFEAILNSLGYRKQTLRVARRAIARPVDKPAPGAEAAPQEAGPAPVAAGAAAPETLTPAAPQDEIDAGGDAPIPEAAPPPSGDLAQATAPADPREAADAPAGAPAADAELTDVVVWRMAPKRPPRRPRENQRPARDAGEGKREERPRRGKPKGRDDRPREERPREPREPRGSPLMTMPQHRKVADPNSPFAILAGLKDELAKSGGEPNKSGS
jgi:ATP-dependent RNA helicase SUPV3L1/SUV3